MVRIVNSFDESFLLDTGGTVMPVSKKHPVRLLVASGDIMVRKDTLPSCVYMMPGTSILRNISTLAHSIYKDKFLHALISQIYVNSEGEIELIPAVGDQVILLGSIDNMAMKLKKLKAFYKQVMAGSGWDKYNTINLTFDNQVVCSKQ
jgi:cell division protein FtsQ